MNNHFSNQNYSMLTSVLEGFINGILILHPQGNLLYRNSSAICMCEQLHQVDQVPPEVWRACEALIESRELYNERIIIESEIPVSHRKSYRVQVQWIELAELNEPCLLVRLEDQQQAMQGWTFVEAKKCGLTPREREVLYLKRCNLSRKEIAEQLYITIDTVKKHLGNIQTKRQAMSESWR
jgi:DNA-binding CsgD family transcriptional regulator